MRLIGAIIALVPLLTILRIFNKRELLAPTNLYSLLYIVTIMIPTIIYAGDTSAALLTNGYLREAVSDNAIYLTYTVIQTVGYHLVLFGMGLRLKDRKLLYVSPKAYRSVNEGRDYSSTASINYKFWGILFTVAGFGVFILMMQKVGGIYYFLTHLQYRSSMTRDLDLLSWFLPLLQYGPLIIVYSLRGTGKRMSVWLLILIVIAGFCYGLGGRKAIILMLFETITIYHYAVRPISLRDALQPKYIILGITLVIFFVTYVQFRREGALESFLLDPYSFINGNNQGIAKVFTSESYVSFYMATIKYFKENALWKGASYLGLLTAIIPSSLYAGKPPVDDGMYLYSICQGRTDIMPVMKTSSLNGSSYPLETFGSTYANFGVFGVIIGMVFLGIVIGYFYKKLEKSNYNLFYIIIYAQVIFGFELSTLRMFQLFQAIVVAWMMVKFTELIGVSNSKKNIMTDSTPRYR